ncbi:MAG: MBL fold metallo-hydrolase [Candidatus Caldarchaeum sp.]|nr:MBL fold metallo-hydrolase [Candidatus Caldarchaeum sp.]MDW8360085.1 MBL fold metallo-hydrolase [Candidatus Caldarchaeum sp.]
MEVSFLGGSLEVGRSAVLVSYKNTKVLLDYGVMLNDHPEFPLPVETRKLNAAILTHAHLDHSGALPMLYISYAPKLYCTSMTKDTATLLIQDFIKLSGEHLVFEKKEMDRMLQNTRTVYYREPFRVGDLEIELVDAGHIPGSAQVVVNGDKTLAYTGDFTTVRTRLLDGADTIIGNVDAVVIESTYAHEDHRPRPELEKEFVKACREVVENGGTVLVPAFSVGRAQEIVCILTAHNFKHPLWLDGMAKKAMEFYLGDKKFIDGVDVLEKASRKTRMVHGRRGRETALSEPSVIVSPAGMLKGGPAMYYAPRVVEDEKSAIFLASFQIPGTPGEILLNRGVLVVDGAEKPANCQVKQFRFSGHAGRAQLHDYLRKVESNAKVFTIHGEPQQCMLLASWASKELGAESTSPERGQTYKL